MNEELRLTDAIPKRLATYLVLLLAAAGAIAGIELLHAWMSVLSSYTGGHPITAFDLAADASLCTYFSSASLLLASLVAVLIYMVRRHRLDDYHGQYRIWLWAALCWLVFSIDEVAQLHQGFKALMVNITGTKLYGDGSLWWIVPYFFCLGAVGLRLLVDMCECILSTAVGILAAACCAAAVAIHCHWLPAPLVDLGAHQVMVEQGLKMGAEVFLLLAMLLHGRYVIRDAEGNRSADAEEEVPTVKTKVVVRKPRKAMTVDFQEITADGANAVANEKKTAAALAVDSSHPLPSPVAASLTLGRAASATATNAAQPQKKMTKAERKALRKRLDNMQQEREN